MAIGKTKDYNRNEFARLLLDNGFELDRIKGNHLIYKRGNDIIVSTKDRPNKMMIRRYIKEFNLKF